MTITTEKLTAWNRFADFARSTALAARLAYAQGDAGRGRALLQELEQAAAAQSSALEAAGADRPQTLPSPLTVPLDKLSTEASRRYARLMREAYEAARAVDYERDYGDDGPADVLEGFAEAAGMDAYGRSGLLRE